MSTSLDGLWRQCRSWDDQVNGLANRTNARSQATTLGVENRSGDRAASTAGPLADTPPQEAST